MYVTDEKMDMDKKDVKIINLIYNGKRIDFKDP